MNPRHLNILIAVLYAFAALSLLGMGRAREKLNSYQAAQQTEVLQDSTAAAEPAQPVQEIPVAPEELALRSRLNMWQIIAICFFGTASLLLVLKDKLVKKKPEAPEQH
ncbi:hypothetical protein [Cesiribacter sp. SM1]|uniref:hypothetical protein n=1 Tax=Cesiribacter sp. SM1 TaxID=2861196 RepID=UPI001CD3099C|nr:hypothetical protein [Cesiribacter sp. SM1]